MGFLGLGTMGLAMARRLLVGGHTVVVWNRSPRAVETLVSEGAVAAKNPEEALSTGASFSMFANDAAAEGVLTPSAARASTGGFHANMASVSPECGDQLHAIFSEAGARYVSSPVLGRPPVAAAGELNILVAGDESAAEAAQPFFDLMGKKTWSLGSTPSQANIAKVAVNLNIIHAIQAIGESVALVEGAGIDPEHFVELLTSSLFGGVAYSGYGKMIAASSYLPQGFSLELGLKDLTLATNIASSQGKELASADVLSGSFHEALSRPELTDLDWAALAEVSRRPADSTPPG
ncbi:NAD(P)-dependent oxidoreductase [Pontimonas sp.]|nr:NAD(P)-dependent oxidoreductase [Pontimonas sp.]